MKMTAVTTSACNRTEYLTPWFYFDGLVPVVIQHWEIVWMTEGATC